MSASSTPTFRPLAASPSAMLTAVVDLPTPPLPDATAMIEAMPGTPRLPWLCEAGACWAGRAAGAAAGRGAGAAAGAAGRGAAGRGGASSMPPPFFSAVSATMAPATPGIALTTRSAAARSGSISCARAAGTVIEKKTLASAMKISETRPRSTMLPVKSGPFTVFRRSMTASLVMLMLVRPFAENSDSASRQRNQAARTTCSGARARKNPPRPVGIAEASPSFGKRRAPEPESPTAVIA